MNFTEIDDAYRASSALLESGEENLLATSVHHAAYLKFNTALNDFSLACQSLELDEVPDIKAYTRRGKKIREAYVSLPLPAKQIIRLCRLERAMPKLDPDLAEKYYRLESAERQLAQEEVHPYEDLISSAVGEGSEKNLLIRIVVKSKFIQTCTPKIYNRLSEYENLATPEVEIEIVSPRDAAGSTRVADHQIVLGNVDYLCAHPFEDYRSLSAATARRLHVICLDPHARWKSFGDYFLVLEENCLEVDFERYEVGDKGVRDPTPVESDLVFPELRMLSHLGGFNDAAGDDNFEIVYEGAEREEVSNNRHVIRVGGNSSGQNYKIISAETVGAEELQIGDIVVLQKKGLRADELSSKFQSNEDYQRIRSLAVGWKNRLKSRDGFGEIWTLNRIRIKGGEALESLNEGHLSRWKRNLNAGPRELKVFKRLLEVLDYNENEVTEIISAKKVLDNHHRQSGKSAAKAAASKLVGVTVDGDVLSQHLEISVNLEGSSLDFVAFRLVDVYVNVGN